MGMPPGEETSGGTPPGTNVLECWFWDICNDCDPPAYKCHFEAVIQGAVPCNQCPDEEHKTPGGTAPGTDVLTWEEIFPMLSPHDQEIVAYMLAFKQFCDTLIDGDNR